MGIFSTLLTKIFSFATSASAAHAPVPQTTPTSISTTEPATASALATPPPSATPAPSTPFPATPVASPTPPVPQSVDVGAIMDGLAKKNPEQLDWKHSIVDLLKLVGMDSSLTARKELAKELNYTGDPSDSATMNVWLHKEVLNKIAANGGKLPPGLI